MSNSIYDEWYYNRPQAKKYLSDTKIWTNLVDMIQVFEPNCIFEFGSGLGNVVAEASERGLNIVGSETSEYALSHNLMPQKVMRIGQIPESKLPFSDNTFDLVFSTEVFEHIPIEVTDAVIAELARICSKCALLTINTFDTKQPGHINVHPHDWWVNRFEANGFSENVDLTKKIKSMRHLKWDIFVFDKGMPHHKEVKKKHYFLF